MTPEEVKIVQKDLFKEIDEKFEMAFACRCSEWCTCWEEFKMEKLKNV